MLRTMPEGEGAEPSIRERIRTDRERWTELEERTRDRLLTHARAEAAAIEARLAARVPRPMRRLLGPAAHAFVRGRGYVTPEDVKSIAFDVLRHRIILTYEAEAEDVTTEQIIQRVLDTIEVP